MKWLRRSWKGFRNILPTKQSTPTYQRNSQHQRQVGPGVRLDIVRNHWGEGAEPARAPVPEPSILVLLLAGVSCLVVFPCRR